MYTEERESMQDPGSEDVHRSRNRTELGSGCPCGQPGRLELIEVEIWNELLALRLNIRRLAGVVVAHFGFALLAAVVAAVWR